MRRALFSLLATFAASAAYADESVTVWVNAFIPQTIDGLTHKVPAGPHKDKTAIHGPLKAINDCFLTDQRSFSTEETAASRVSISISVKRTVSTFTHQVAARCDDTIEVDCEDGDEECREKGAVDRCKWEAAGATATKATYRLSAAASNPCFTGSPDIDLTGDLTIDFSTGKAIFSGKVDSFPAYEMYVRTPDGTVKTLFRREVQPGTSPSDLFGGATTEVSGSVDW